MQHLEVPDDLYEEFQRLVERRAFETTPSEYTQRLIRRELGQYDLPDYAERDKLTDCCTRAQLYFDLRHQFSIGVYYATLQVRFVCDDIADFKKFNDTQGFAEGDQRIQEVAGWLREAYPRETVYRVGGDKFIVSVSTTPTSISMTASS